MNTQILPSVIQLTVRRHISARLKHTKRSLNPSLAKWGSLGTRHKSKAHTTSGFCVDEENNIYTASIHKYREACSSEVLGAQVSSNHAPAYSLHSLDPGALLNSHDHLNGDKHRKALISKEERTIQPAYVRLQDVGNHHAEIARQSSSSSAYMQRPPLPTHVMQTGKNVASHKEFVQTREKDFFTMKAERKALLHVAEESTHLTRQEKHLENKEADIPARKVPPWQDAESFLLKVQRAKQRCIEPFGMLHTAAAESSGVDVNSEIVDSNLSDNDEFMLLKQESLEYRNNDYRVRLKSHSVAELEHAKNQAVRYLSMRPYTAAQLRKKLVGNTEPGLADYAIDTVQSCGLQSDIAYAETFSLGRFKYSGWGPQRIKMGLKQRGIKDEIINAAIDTVFCEEEGNLEEERTEERSNGTGMSKAAMDHLLVQATKQWNRGKTVTVETKTRRLVCWLQYRGFNYGVVKHVLNHLQKEVPMADEY